MPGALNGAAGASISIYDSNAMNKRVTLKEVALAARVSTATVSRVLSSPNVVSASTREQVMAAVRKLDYQPDAVARTLASGQSRTVGCVVPTLDHAIFARSTQAMQTTLARAGYQLLIASHEYDLDTEFEVTRVLQQRGVDALVLVGTDHAPELWEALSRWNKPSLLTWSCDPRLPSVGFDNEAAAKLAAQHLIRLGHREIGVISGFTQSNDRARSRIAGVRSALGEVGLKLAPERITEQPFSFLGGGRGLKLLMKERRPPTAIFCGNDLLAVGAMMEARRMGIDIPHQLSICGIDNLEIGEVVSPQLTTISLPTQELGRIAAQCVLSAISGQKLAIQYLLPFQLETRNSTAARA
ncbi:MAG: LacI family transcriptional regulator [Comamonadaceae bacterium]|nr:LacI family transcriptional regulator [Comamonadaceae bacterium]